jgi:hypothetical protein
VTLLITGCSQNSDFFQQSTGNFIGEESSALLKGIEEEAFAKTPQQKKQVIQGTEQRMVHAVGYTSKQMIHRGQGQVEMSAAQTSARAVQNTF